MAPRYVRPECRLVSAQGWLAVRVDRHEHASGPEDGDHDRLVSASSLEDQLEVAVTRPDGEREARLRGRLTVHTVASTELTEPGPDEAALAAAHAEPTAIVTAFPNRSRARGGW